MPFLELPKREINQTMNPEANRGFDRSHLTPDFIAEEARKSDLLLQAALLREQGQEELASARFADAAEIEEQLANRAEEAGDTERSLRYRFSAASGWAQAGDFHHALSLLRTLSERADTSPSLRERIQSFTETVRAQRGQWHAALREASLT
jgi:hypothetical protein